MRSKALLILMALAPTACMTAPMTPQVASGGTTCTNEGLDRFIGQRASAELGVEAMKTSRAGTMRWGAPGMAMTMDYREDRLTVSYDEAMLVTSARCG